MRRSWGARYLSGAAVLVLLAVSGCTGGTPDSAPSPSGTAAPSSRWRAGEFTTDRLTCDAISPQALSRLNMDDRPQIVGNLCHAYESAEDGDVTRSFDFRVRRYTPSKLRPDSSATGEARHEFRHPNEWRNAEYGSDTAVRGLGDEAKIARLVLGHDWTHRAAVTVRVRNVVFQVRAEVQSHDEHARGGVQPIGDLETGVLAAAREVLARLTPGATPPPAASYRPGEVRTVRDVCDSVDASDRLFPGVTGDRSASASPRGGGCMWEREHGDEKNDFLLVNVEAVPPSPVGGVAATRVAAAVARPWSDDTPASLRGVADDVRRFRYDGGRLHHASVQARRGNLLVSAEFKRWTGGAPKRSRAMEKQVVGVVKQIFADYG